MWMPGVLALELAYFGLQFQDVKTFYDHMDVIREKGKLPKNLVGDDQSQTRSKILFWKDFETHFTTFVLRCLAPVEERPTIRVLTIDPYLPMCTNLPSKYFR